MSDEVPFVRKEFSDQVARTIYPAMKGEGLGRQGKRLWYDRRPDTSWVLVEIQVSDHTTRTKLEFTVNTAVWPPGTWAIMQRVHPLYAAEPTAFTSAAPIFGRPGQVRPDLWPGKEFAEVTLADGVDRAVADLLVFLLAALEWGRGHAGLEEGLAYMTKPFDARTHRQGANYWRAIEMLREVKPDHPRLPELLELFTQSWRANPSQITLRDQLQRWRAEAGLAPVEDLPTYWHANGEFHFADGTRSKTPPPDWPRHGEDM